MVVCPLLLRSYISYGHFLGKPIDSPLKCKRLIELMSTASDQLVPSFFGHCEPVKEKFSVEKFAASWGEMVMWKNPKSKAEGDFWPHDRLSPFDILHLDVDNALGLVDPLKSMLFSLANEFDGHFGYIQVCTEKSAGMADYRENVMPYIRGLSWKSIQHRLPGVPWAMALGREFVQKIGREKILSAPAHLVSELSTGFYLQLTPHATDAIADERLYFEKRQALACYFGADIVAPHVSHPPNE